jgi:hypothetical protein
MRSTVRTSFPAAIKASVAAFAIRWVGVPDSRDRQPEWHYEEVIGGFGVRVMSARAKKPHRQDADRVERVFGEFQVPRWRGLLSDLARRFNMSKATVRCWFGRWIGDRRGRRDRCFVPGNPRLFSDELEERIVPEIEDTFWKEERNIS